MQQVLKQHAQGEQSGTKSIFHDFICKLSGHAALLTVESLQVQAALVHVQAVWASSWCRLQILLKLIARLQLDAKTWQMARRL